MKNIALIFTLFGASLAISSCSHDDMPGTPNEERENDSRLITLRTSLSSCKTRGELVGDNIDHCVVTIFNANNPHQDPEQDATFNPWLTKVFEAEGDKFKNEDVIWPEKDSPETGEEYGDGTQPLHFYVHYPNLEESSTPLTPVNNSTYNGPGDYTVDYSLADFTVAEDISAHIDFMTAYAETKLPDKSNKNREIDLDFQHQLSAIEIKAKGEHTKYKIEIAGVMIGNIIDKGKFRFQTQLDNNGKLTSTGQWITNAWNEDNTEIIKSQNPVTYIHQKDEEHVTPDNDSPLSIMGNAGYAMVIPFRSNAWDNKKDPDNKYKGTYFAVLVHVTDKEGKQVYPYPSETDTPDGYQPGLRVAATIGDKDYGWAAIPVKLNLLAGKKYSYTLDFSKGIGVLPPDDPDPGKPIFANDHIDISLSVYDWVEEEITITPDFSSQEGDDNQEGGDDQSGDNQEGGTDDGGNEGGNENEN